jgi:fused signal recognition particle receptor
MFGFGKKKEASNTETAQKPVNGWRGGLAKTRAAFMGGIGTLFGRKKVDAETLEELETLLLSADVGLDTTDAILDKLRQSGAKNGAELTEALRAELTAVLTPVAQPLTLESTTPFVILVVGVNGVGKTTTIGKLAYQLKQQGKSVMLAAGDTFRAAAVEQLISWGETNDVPVISQGIGSDSASVIYDAAESAVARNVDVLIADTAGRLHTKSNLMEELKKIRRVVQKINPDYPHEVLLVLDAGTGQNALSQARAFHEAMEVSGLVLTKLDGTAKGGIVFTLAQELGLPVRFIGVGERAEDLRVFSAAEFVGALFDES